MLVGICKKALLFRPRFGLLTLFALMAMCSLLVGTYTRRCREQKAAVKALLAQRATVYYDFQETSPGSGRFRDDRSSPLPQWLKESLGDDFFYNVVFVSLRHEQEVGQAPAVAQLDLVRELKSLRRLRRLLLPGDETTDEWLAIIGCVRSLESLVIFDASEVTDAGVAALGNLTRLRRLVLTNSRIGDESLRVLGRLPLKELLLDGSHFSALGLSHLRGNSNLQMLHLAGGRLDVAGAGMSFLGDLVELTDLNLSHVGLALDGFAQLKQLTKLRNLDLSGNPLFGDSGMEMIESLDSLETLNLQDTGITSSGLAHLQHLNNLRTLQLGDNGGITDETSALLSQLPCLERLDLSNTAVTWRAIEQLQRLPQLRHLDLSENDGITEQAIPLLAEMTTLATLDLHNTNVALGGILVRANLARLRSLTGLKILDLAGTGACIHAIALDLPACHVAGSRASEGRELGLGKGRDFVSITTEIMLRRKLEYDGHVVAGQPDYVTRTSQELLKRTVRRMVSIAASPALGSKFAETSRLLEAWTLRLERSSRQCASERDVSEFVSFVRTNDGLSRLYEAASNCEFADAVSEYVRYLDGVRERWALTDSELEEYDEASAVKRNCLRNAAKQLDLKAGSAPAVVEDPIIALWEATRTPASSLASKP